MDTSTPLKKFCSKQLSSLLSSKYNNGDCSNSSKHENNPAFPVQPAESDYLFCDSKYTNANTSIEVFPVSPICCAKNASSNLVNLPNLNSSNLKWSTSLHTSHAEEELFIEETMDPIRSQCQCTAEYYENATSLQLIEPSEGIGNERFEVIRNASDVPCSPVFTAARGKRRRKDKEPAPDEKNVEQIGSSRAGKGLSDSVSEDIRCLNEHAFELDDSYSSMFNVTTRPSESTTLKTSRYSLDLGHENSKKFVYPLASEAIKKPESHLRVDQLTNYALSLEARDLRLGTSSRKSEAKTKTNVLSQNTMIVFNELFDDNYLDIDAESVVDKNHCTVASQHQHRAVAASTVKYENIDKKSYPEVLRNFAKILFACRNNDRVTILRRFDKITDRFSNSDCIAARLMRFLYSSFYIVTFIDLVSCRTDRFYQHNAVQHLRDLVSGAFRFTVSSDYVEKTFNYIENDLYSLEKLGVPVATLYGARFKTLCCLSSDSEIDSTNLRSESATVVNVLESKQALNFKENMAGDLADSAPFSGFRTANGNRLNIPEKSLKRFVNKYSDVFDGQRDNDVLCPVDKKRRIETNSAFIIPIATNTKLSSSSSSSYKVNRDIVGIVNGFRTGTGKTVCIQTKSLQTSKPIFSDILDQALESNSEDHRENVPEKLNETPTSATCGFKTCSGKTIKVSDKLLQKSKNLFSDISTDADNFDGDRADASRKQKEQPASGFKSIFGRTIKVNDQLLRKSRNLFTDILTETEPSFEAPSRSNSEYKRPLKTLVSSSKSSSSTIKVSNELLQKSKNLFSDIFAETECSFGAASASNGECKRTDEAAVSGFKTGSGRTIKVDDQLLQKSKNLFSDISTETGCDLGDVARSNGAYKRPIKTEVVGFKTSSGRTIKINDDSLRTSKNLFSDVSVERECNLGDAALSNGPYKRPVKAEAVGFKTGSGQAIKVNDESLRTSKNLFSGISAETEWKFGDTFKRPTEAETSGIKTGSGRAIEADKKLFQTCKNLFSDISVETKCDFGDVPRKNSAYKRPTKTTEALGFKTSSGRTIKINNDSLQTSKNLFSDISVEMECDFDSDSSLKRPDETAISGFKTSSGRGINVSDNLSQLSKNLFSDVPNETEPIAGVVDTDVANNFKSGANKAVKVSAQLLEKSKNSLCDIRSSPDTATKTPQSMNEKEKDMKDESARKSSPPRVHNQSFDLSREIMESASAFLFDISHEQSGSSFFVPNETSAIAKTTSLEQSSSSFLVPNETSTVEKTNSLVEEHHRSSDVSNVTASSRSSSPVFDSKYAPTKRKCSSRRSSGVQSLNITFGGRKTNDSSASSGSGGSSDQISTELETLKMNFSLKSKKRKSTSLDDSQVAAKKSRNISQLSSPDEDEKLATSRHRTAAVAHQQRYISNKPKEFCRPTRGYLSTLINGGKGAVAGRTSLGQLACFEKPKLYSFDEYLKFGLLPAVIRMTSQNARNFIFTSQFISNNNLTKTDSNGASLFGDAVPIVLNEKNEVTLEEITRGFLASPGVDPKLISRKWITNHYRWIVWKLASMERFFPKSLGRRYLTLDNFLFQLKFKYEQEIDQCVRSALKRILEGDDSPARPLVLCIASIEKGANSSNDYKVELTDGWYSIFAQTDDQINDLISRKKISIGGKIIIIGAELIGFREPCDPLQTSESVRLKFSANSSRRVRWDTRLGFYLGNRSLVNRIQTILPKGGFISHLTAVVARVYPLLFLEKYDNPAADTSAGRAGTSTVTWSRLHNEKVEMKKIMAFERDRQSYIESILSQVTNEVLKENAKTNADIILTGDSSSQQNNDRLRDIIQQRVQSRLPVQFSKNRHVSRLLKLRLVDAQDTKNKPSAILTIWNPCDDVSNFFKEDRCYNFININANQIRNGELQLCSTRSSKYDRSSPRDSSECGNDHWFRRRIRGVDDLNERTEDDGKICSFDEVDVIGVIIKIQSKGRSCDYEQNDRIYVADLQRRFFALSFRIDSKNFDYGDSLESGKIIAGLNLQWKKGWLCWNTPILYVSEFSSFVQSTNIASLHKGIDQIRRHFQTNNLETFIAECTEKLNSIVDSTTDISSNETNRSSISNVNLDTTPTSTTSSPAPATDSSNKNKPNNQASFKNANTQCRFEKLQNYGRPPALSPLVLTSKSKLKAKLPLPVSRKSFKS